LAVTRRTGLLESIELVHGIDAGWDGASRTALIDGVMTVGWWVAFDEPQFDEDGEGPIGVPTPKRCY